jgi:hypothetical protein
MMFRPHIFDGIEPNGNLLHRGRDYGDPIGDMVRAIPSGTDLDHEAVRSALCDTRRYTLVLIDACLDRVVTRIELRCAHAARATLAKIGAAP